MQEALNSIFWTILNSYRHECSLDEYLSAMAKIIEYDEKTIGQVILAVIQRIDA